MSKLPLDTQDCMKEGVSWKELYPKLAKVYNWFFHIFTSVALVITNTGAVIIALNIYLALGIIVIITLIFTVSAGLLFSQVIGNPKPTKVSGIIIFFGTIIGIVLSFFLNWIK